ncbi:MAG: 2-hydroxychromene-2-carboxylate isomerase [Deltaproteobacteria bacterium]|nr:2-hydroxychromene-2-carboxylate isomerase [Deltaproteobacteria bacterium]
MNRVEFFYDYASTYSYLAHREIEALAARREAEIVFKPMVLGFVFKATGNSMPAAVPAKAAYMVHDVRRWVRHYGLPFHMPSVFPVNTIRALRTAVAALEEGTFAAYHHAVMQAYWANDQDIGDGETLASIATAAGLDGARLVARAEEPSIKEGLKANTDEAIRRGVFGAPTFFVGDEMFWGNDRLHFVEEALSG